MMKKFLLAAAILTTLSAHAMAGDACSRSGSTIKLGGMDLDEMRCQLAITAQAMGQLQLANTGMQAKLTLMQEDLTAAQKTIADLNAKAAPAAPAAPAPDAPKP